MPHGHFAWYELTTPDLPAAQRFYPAVTGWRVEKRDGDPPYREFVASGGPVAGLVPLPTRAADAGAPAAWTAYVEVDDVDSAAARVQALGGRVVAPVVQIPGVGRFVTVADPDGATLALITSEGSHPLPQGPGGVAWHELYTAGVSDALAFYGALFGWLPGNAVDVGGGEVYQLYTAADGTPLGGMFKRPQGMPVSAWMIYVHVPDLDAAVSAVRSEGGQVLNGPMQVPSGDRIVQCADPSGAMFALHTPAA